MNTLNTFCSKLKYIHILAILTFISYQKVNAQEKSNKETTEEGLNYANGITDNKLNPMIDLDIEVKREIPDEKVSISYSTTAERTKSNNGSYAEVENGGNQSEVETNSPGNPDEPDTPIDGGVSILIAAGVVYGAKKYHKRINSEID